MVTTRRQAELAKLQQGGNTESEETPIDNEESENVSEEEIETENDIEENTETVNYRDLLKDVSQDELDEAKIKKTPTLSKGTLTTPTRTQNIPKPKISETDHDKNDQTKWPLYYIIGLCLIFIAALVGLYLKDPNHWSAKFDDYLKQSTKSSSLRPDKIITSLDELLNTPQFNEHVPAYGLTVMKNAFRNALDPNVKAPVLLLLMATQNQNDLVHNISHQLASLIATGETNDLWPDSYEINSTHTEGDIESFYSSTFVQQKQPVLLLENLEQLDSANAMVFHQYTDGDNSVTKSTFTIVTLKYQQKVTVDFDVSLRQLSEISANELTNLWSNSWSKDNLDCVINRIAENTVVLVNK